MLRRRSCLADQEPGVDNIDEFSLPDIDFDAIVLDDDSPARQCASESELATVSAAVQELFVRHDTSAPKMRSVQARALGYKGIGSGRDVIITAATGTGKSKIQYSHAAADAIAALQCGETAPRPLDVIVVPTKAVAEMHERDGTEFLACVCDGCVPQHWVPRAEFVRRHHQRGKQNTYEAQRLCCKRAMPHAQPLKDKTREQLGWCSACYKMRTRPERTMIAACERLKSTSRGPVPDSPLTGRLETRTRSATDGSCRGADGSQPQQPQQQRRRTDRGGDGSDSDEAGVQVVLEGSYEQLQRASSDPKCIRVYNFSYPDFDPSFSGRSPDMP